MIILRGGRRWVGSQLHHDSSSRPPRLDPPRRAGIPSKGVVPRDDGDGAAATPSCLAGVVPLLLLLLADAAAAAGAGAVKFYK